MKRVHAFIETISAEIAQRSSQMGDKVSLDASVLDRSDSITLAPPGRTSPNGSCRLMKAQDGWIAANLPREEDLQSIAALLEIDDAGASWEMLAEFAPKRSCADLIARAELLGLAIVQTAETPPPSSPCVIECVGETRERKPSALRVVDMSSLWAGPLSGSILAAMGADVTKIESAERPDPTPRTAPLLDQGLNGQKRRSSISFASRDDLDRLTTQITQSDMLITSARKRALDALGLTRERLLKLNPNLVWVAVTGHGWTSDRIAFGDDAAAAGGLLNWEDDGPRFVGDALADPLTGLAAAASALEALQQGGGAFIDAALTRTAAFVGTSGSR